MTDFYYILSLKWTRSGEENLTWWGRNNSGYAMSLDDAGRYSTKDVASHRSYYDNREDTLAIPCEVVDRWASRVVHVDAANEMVSDALGVEAGLVAPWEVQLDEDGKPWECGECEQRPQHKGRSKLILRAKSDDA